MANGRQRVLLVNDHRFPNGRPTAWVPAEALGGSGSRSGSGSGSGRVGGGVEGGVEGGGEGEVKVRMMVRVRTWEEGMMLISGVGWEWCYYGGFW
ncbi:hypothetical protein TWF718_005545 [Orbilia javanica]|uniref:Uncharacterized protein n=1 Tax=Orbilia javanica TaxID=47235 RepID=A0AAN8RIX4_9PEZI